MKRLLQKITYHIERFMLGGVKNQLLVVAFLIILISVVSGYLIFKIYPGTTLSDAVWWGFLRLSDPGYLGDDKELARKVISTIVTILGYVVFLGSLVAIMTQWLNSTMKKLESGLTPISLKGHILILGWTKQSYVIIKELLLSEERVSNFLKRIGRPKLRIVILTQEVNIHIVQELKESLGPLWNKRKIIFRMGNPLILENLKRVDFANASTIIMPTEHHDSQSNQSVDSNTFKILMSISNFAKIENITCPNFTTEIHDVNKISVIKSLYNGNLEIIASHKFISRIMSQATLHPGLSLIFNEIFSYEGSEIYLHEFDEGKGYSFIDVCDCFPTAIVLGIFRKSDNEEQVYFNPHASFIIEEHDFLILLAEELKDTKDYYLPEKPGSKSIDYIYKQDIIPQKLHVLIIGWNRKIASIVTEFNKTDMDVSIDIFSLVPIEEREALFKKYEAEQDTLTINHIIGNATVFHELEELNFSSYTNIMLLAVDYAPPEEADARTTMSFAFVQHLLTEHNQKPHLIIELLDPSNEMNFAHYETDIIVTPVLLNYSLALVAIRNELRQIFDELISTGGTDIYIYPIEYYSIPEGSHTFKQLSTVTRKYNDIAIGLYITGKTREYILNPQKDISWDLHTGDNIIVLSTGDTMIQN